MENLVIYAYSAVKLLHDLSTANLTPVSSGIGLELMFRSLRGTDVGTLDVGAAIDHLVILTLPLVSL